MAPYVFVLSAAIKTNILRARRYIFLKKKLQLRRIWVNSQTLAIDFLQDENQNPEEPKNEPL